MNGSPIGCSEKGRIPVLSREVGSWHVAISRRTRTPGELTRQYDAAAKNWARTADRYRLEEAYRRALAASGVADARRDMQVLDCGIGSGSLSLALNGLLSGDASFYGIDVSGEMLTAANSTMRQAGLAPLLKKADVREIPYADRFFDVVMAAHVLEHLPEPRQALREMMRVLKPGGLLFCCMTRRSVFGALIQFRWRTWAVTEAQAAGWLRDCQMSDIGLRPLDLGSCAGRASIAVWGRRLS
ncbi:class I SAM-dependent methyltransferase [Roseobacter sp. YSTF-M11]|uniref:Class I SAM-dependent methyltransferase n=1 Tax=Roseobacter insulae TaxID=2859783 RepID=A0A9X1FX50_9RHOB|nr:class I SAM-dependent methyltransferase [Roseobacter insulae]MBW4709715.1 class I SAM-dependent methyltransferase [Roseobacter insulae]